MRQWTKNRLFIQHFVVKRNLRQTLGLQFFEILFTLYDDKMVSTRRSSFFE